MVECGIACAVSFAAGSLAMWLGNRGAKSRSASIQSEKEYLGRKLDEANDWIRSKFGDNAGPKS